MSGINEGRVIGRARGRTNRLRDEDAAAARPGLATALPQVSISSTLQLGLQAMEINDPEPCTLPQVSGRARGGFVPRSGSSGPGGGPSAHVGEPSGPAGEVPVQQLQVRTRPATLDCKKGSTGRQVPLSSNYFRLCSLTDWVLYQYHTEFAPEEDRPDVRKRLLRDHHEVLGGFIFDGMIVYSSHRLNSPTTLLSTRREDGAKVVITLKFTRQINEGDHEYLQFFNILMRKCLGALKLKLVGRDFFDPVTKIDMSVHKMELWPGYKTSIRQHENEILMCTEITHKVMRTDTVLHLLMEIQANSSRNFQDEFKDAALGLVVLTGYNNRTYRVDDVDYNVNPRSRFHLKDGRDISYAEYYQQRHNIEITHMTQPLLVTRSKARDLRAGVPETVYLVPELCRMTGLTDEMRNNHRLMSALAEHTRMGPSKRTEKLLMFSQRLRNEPVVVQELEQWNMAVSETLVKFNGRILPNETIIQGGQGREVKYPTPGNVDWTGQLKRNHMLTAAKMDKWVVMVPRNMLQETEAFFNVVMRNASSMGMTMMDPFVRTISDERIATYINELEELLSTERPLLVVCIISRAKSDLYGAIKKKCCVDRAVPTQVVTTSVMRNKGVQSIASKVAIQINCKVGGAPWAVEIPITGVMVVGFDASHDTMNKGLSYGALVASLNNNFSRYYSAVTAHKSGEELSNEISINLVKALQKFRLYNNGQLPSRIIIYRDGVGDGQIPYVYKHEVSMLKEKLDELYGGPNWRMSFIIVSKRINTRIFEESATNPLPGTVVDDCVTLPDRYDFFLVSQSVRQGTVSPTSYNVISDNSGLSPDKIQRLTYKMTHLYYNWSGTVRVPAPVQYAHKLAQLVGQHLHRPPQNILDDLLYFL